ncbi:Stealth CR1 domain-containing protein [Candidatus Saccharibacteria bacterium]|nr:Stealth CR1 domain-containing protein [Candidatus Saccharibacteria bacterium]
MKRNNGKDGAIDIVVTWVDGSDPEWIKDKERFKNDGQDSLLRSWNDSSARYRDWGLFKYWFRGIEKNCKWVRKVFFVTYGHLPEWLNVDNPKLVVVKHKDFIPEKYLPTFNSNAIELNLHRINGLSENFVYFNDDMFVLKKLKKEDFFKNGMPRGSAILNLVMPDDMGHSEYNNTVLLNRSFSKNKVLKKNVTKWFNIKYFPQIIRTFCLLPWPKFPRLFESHLAVPHQKKYFNEMWKKFNKELDASCSHHIRSEKDNSHWLMSDWYLVKGDFVPRRPNLGRHFEKRIDDEIITVVTKKKCKIACINDVNAFENEADFVNQKTAIINAFEKLFPDKSAYEK